LLKGKETVRTIEGIEEYRQFKAESMNYFGIQNKPMAKDQQPIKSVQIKTCGVYKFESSPMDRTRPSATDRIDFNPKDFIDKRS
jgi:hypothetical protein